MQTGYFVIADLSGYTRFVTENDLAHAQGVLHDLITLIIDKLGAPLEFVELEGDAVFVYAREAAVSDAERLLDLMEACYAAFKMRTEQMVRNTTCPCTACRSIPKLDLKCVAHLGRFMTQPTPKGPQLVGPDVVLVHRLLKNRVIEATGIQAYALLTDAFMAKAGMGMREQGTCVTPVSRALPGHVEEVEAFGQLQLHVLDLAECVERHRERFRENLDALPVDLEIITPMLVPPSMVWGYLTEPQLKPLWQTDIVGVSNVAAPNGRTDVGWEGHCDHGGYKMVHRIVDWRPFDRITLHTIPSGLSLTKPLPCQVDFLLEPGVEGQCQLRFCARLRGVGLLTRLFFRLVKPLILRQWQAHFRKLQEVVAQQSAAVMTARPGVSSS